MFEHELEQEVLRKQVGNVNIDTEYTDKITQGSTQLTRELGAKHSENIELLTKKQLEKAIPINITSHVADKVLDIVNAVILNPNDPIAEDIRTNILTLGNVLSGGVFGVAKYVNAVKYVSYKLAGMTSIDSWGMVFPERHRRLISKGFAEKEISSHCGGYNRSLLVTRLLEQTLVPSYILNAGVFQQAVNEQVRLMLSAKSEKVRSDAANSLLVHLKAPVVEKMQLNIGVTQSNTINTLAQSVNELREVQKHAIRSGIPLKTIAHSNIVHKVIAEDA